jgi:CDP-glycerol glycerophosphotransferase
MKTTVNKLRFFIKILFFYFITFLLGLIIPKRKDLVVITASKGKYYNGNAKALFEHLLTRDGLEVCYFIREKACYEKLSKRKDNIVYHYSFRGLWLFLRARTVCVTHGQADFLGFFPSIWQNWIYLGHGIGTKARLFLRESMSLSEKIQTALSRTCIYIATSDFTRYLLCATYHIKAKKVIVTGYPRTDVLYKNRNLGSKITEHNILYAPTHREGGVTELFPFGDFDLFRLIKFLTNRSLSLDVRFHPNNYKKSKIEIENILNSSELIRDKSPDIVQDPQDLLLNAEVLITDFSSVSRDYLFLDRPMIFIMNGVDNLGKLPAPMRSEFVFCGYQVRTYRELEDALSEILEGRDRFAELRKFVRDLMYNHIDDKSSQRVAELIEELA